MSEFKQIVRFAFRRLWKAPGFALIVIATLSIGVGATTAIFSLIEGVLLRPLPFASPGGLVLVGDQLGNSPGLPVTAREIATYSEATNAFDSLGAYTSASYELFDRANPAEVPGARFNSRIFPTLGVKPFLGRVFTREEEEANQSLVVISYSLWQDRFHRDPHVVGTSLELNRRPYLVIGVMPRGFQFPLLPGHLNQAQLWVPLSLTPDELSVQSAGSWEYHLVGRLRSGVNSSAADRDVNRVAQQIMRDFPPGMSAVHMQGHVKRLDDVIVANARPMLRMLFFTVSISLVIACVNAAVLLLVRAINRRREFAIRLVLGARQSAIVRDSLIEGLMLSLSSGLLGLAAAGIAIRATLGLLPDSMPRIDSISIDGTVAVFSVLLGIATGVSSSLVPAFMACSVNPIEAIKEGTRVSGGTKGHSWIKAIMIVIEIAVVLVLLTAAGALVRSYQNMLAVDPGYRPDHVLVASYELPLEQYPTDASVDAFNHQLMDKIPHKPGVVAAGISTILPASGDTGMSSYTIEGGHAEGGRLKFAAFGTVYGDYFLALGIRVHDGRTFTAEDRADHPLVVLVNESMARHCWPGQSAIGKRMHVGNPKKGLPWTTVVGVVADTKTGSRDEPDGDEWYAPEQQRALLFGSASLGGLTQPMDGHITLRSQEPPEQMVQTLRSTVAEIDPLLALQQVQPMTEAISNVEAPRRFNTAVMGAFASGSVLLAFVGIYSVVSFSVSLRAEEIAIRIAVGANRFRILRMILFSGAQLALFGSGLGVIGAIAFSRLLNSFLFEINGTNPAIYLESIAVVLLVALLASAFPAVRAASVDPIEVLRSI